MVRVGSLRGETTMSRYEGYDPKSEAELKAKIASVLYKDMIKPDEGTCSSGQTRVYVP